MSNKEDNDIMLHGIKQLLGKEDYPSGVLAVKCSHTSDGFIYEQTPMWTTLRCSTCGEHYDVNNNGAEI